MMTGKIFLLRLILIYRCSYCQKIDAGYECPYEDSACLYLPACGDGYTDYNTDEECDDGNNISGDGCDEYCQFEEDSTL